jgi:alkaline phosphatase D
VTGAVVRGTASGDPTTTSVVLWARWPAERPVELRWALGPAGEPDTLTAGGEVHTDPTADGTARWLVDDLGPGRRWWYRVVGPDGHTETGTTATLARDPATVTLGLACCADFTAGSFEPYRWLAERRPDAVVHLGDYVYEHGAAGPRRAHDPPHPCTSLEDYRRRYRQYRRDHDLRALHAAAPWFTLWDDHEFAEDAWLTGSARVGGDRPWGERRQAAARANHEWLPRGSEPGLDRHRRIGELLDLVLLDTRMTGRRRPPAGAGGPAPAPVEDHPRLLSDDQWRWLGEVLDGPGPRWTVLVSSVQLSPLRLAWLPRWRRWRPGLRAVVNPDQWDGYPGERARLLDLLRAREGRVLVLSGDLHARFHTATISGDQRVPELTIPSVSAPSFAALVRRRVPGLPAGAMAWGLRRLNPHLTEVDLVHHGAAALRVEEERVSVTVGPEGPVERVLLGPERVQSPLSSST